MLFMFVFISGIDKFNPKKKKKISQKMKLKRNNEILTSSPPDSDTDKQ